MAEQIFEVNCGFFDSIDNDRLYTAEQMNRPYKRIITNGVFATKEGTPSTDLQVLGGNALEVVVKKGEALFADKWFENPNDLSITVTKNNNIVPRIDSVIAQVDKTQNGRVGSIIYREGTPGSNPQAPTINTGTDNEKVEYRIANVYVPANSNSIPQQNITDLRGSDSCPWVTSLIQQVDTSELFRQYQAAYATYFEESTEEFDEFTESQRQAFNAFMSTLTEELTVNSNIVKYESHVTTTNDGTTVIPIGISAFDRTKDVLLVRVNRLFASEGLDYTISADGANIVLVQDIKKNQRVDFTVLQSVAAGDVPTVLQKLQQLQAQINLIKPVSDTGSTKLSITDSSVNVLDAIMAQDKGFFTIYTAGGVQGTPKTGAYRMIAHKTGETVAWVLAIQADGSTYVNYYNTNAWSGWKILFEKTPSPLYLSVTGAFPNDGANIIPTKTLDQCQHGWELVFTGYDDTNKIARDFYTQTVHIPKRSYTGEAWNGERMTFPLVYTYSSSTDEMQQCIKSFNIFNDRIVSLSFNALGKQRNMVLRAIYEY